MLSAFPDIEAATIHVLDELVHAVTATPADLQKRLPLLQVRRLGGSDDGVTDTARLDVHAFAATRAAAVQLAEAARQLLLDGPHVTPAGVIDRVVTEVAPHSVTHPDPATRQVTATYRASARR